MKNQASQPAATGYWHVVRLLLGSARRRAAGRRKRQQELMRQKKSEASLDLGALATVGAVFLMALVHVLAAYVVIRAVEGGQRLEAERGWQTVVSSFFKKSVEESYANFPVTGDRREAEKQLDFTYGMEARSLARERGGTEAANEAQLRATVRGANGAGRLIAVDEAEKGLDGLEGSHSLAALLGSVALLWWGGMLVFQGEGLELDLQRRRHPMWEWLYTHPVSAGAIFTAEMLAPIAANPVYGAAPVFVGGLYGWLYGPGWGVLAGLLAGVPIALAAACLGKALEIGISLRFSPRSRGALLGLMSWAGYASLMLLALSLAALPKIVAGAGRLLAPLSVVPWPWLGWFLGRRGDGSFSFLAGMLACSLAAGLTLAAAVRFCVWGARQGLSGNFGGADAVKPGPETRGTRFGTEPLYRKEFLWFARDRSAIVQTILIPLTVASFQLFNLRGAISAAQGSWNYLSGAAVLFGTYFLWVLGPKSLASEGNALWLPLTWPRGLENLLKAKAWLWAMISTGIVSLVLLYAVYLFPAEWWKIALLAVGWFVFGQSMAEKAVTLVSVASSSGEPEPIPKGRRWAASLGMLAFAIGVITQQWAVAITGIVYSHLTAAAMWENFRARLPFLYDPWSEKLPPPPTLLHAMVGISLLWEGAAIASAPILLLAGRDHFAVARALSYALCAGGVAYGVACFLAGRNVSNREVWCWRGGGEAAEKAGAVWCGDGSRGGRFWRALLLGLAGGGALGLLGRGYAELLTRFPVFEESIRQTQEQLANSPELKISYAVCAVGIAPFAEEYLFRGLLFRALDREWGGWKAVLGSAAFFAIYHPPLAWLPVGMVGAANALLFKRTGRLAPAVLLHMAYNAVVLW